MPETRPIDVGLTRSARQIEGNLMTCANCEKRFDDNSGFGLEDWASVGTRWALCSISCLTEWAWKLREQQPKLSKSKGSHDG